MTGRQRDDDATERDPAPFGAGTPPAEWAMAAVGALLAFVLLGALVAFGVAEDGEPPAFRTTVVDTVQVDDGTWLVRAEATNTGGSAAAAVTLEGRLADGSVVGEAQLEYVAPGSTGTVGLVVHQPSLTPDTVDVRVVGFRYP